MGVVTDITERKRAEEERQALLRNLQESKARLKEAQRVAHIGHYEWNLIESRVIWSDESYRIFGLTPQEGPVDFDNVREMIHPDDRESIFRAVEEDIRSGVHTMVCESQKLKPAQTNGGRSNRFSCAAGSF